ncbi:histidine kinase [Kribbella sp. NPDC023855]|uniref:sensor histidine kinase n=1 Tax=Kribbella sp. NPDC023855 TaxID=3154698 RepID=UPI0033CD3ECE
MNSADTSTDPDRRFRWARIATLATLGAAWLTSLLAPVLAVVREDRPAQIWSGAIGTALMALVFAVALYCAASPWLGQRHRTLLLWLLAGVTLVCLPLLAPVGGPEWESWAWVGGAVAGIAPLLLGVRGSIAVLAVVLAICAAVAGITDRSVTQYLLVAVSVAVGLAAMCGLPVRMLDLVFQLRAGRAAQAQLAVTEERLRFARDVHDLLGHRLAVIALKAELAARLAPADAARATAEATEAQHLAAAALGELREAVHGYRAIDLTDQLTAIAKLLQSSGVRCTVDAVGIDLPAELSTQLAFVLREAGTNVLRHSRARWCDIKLVRDGDLVTLSIRNDGAAGAGPDSYSAGLHGAAERLAQRAGSLRAEERDGVFDVTVTVPVAS